MAPNHSRNYTTLTDTTDPEVRCDAYIYRNRNVVERLWGRLKEWRAVATQYEKTVVSFVSVLQLAAAMDWLKD